MQDKIPVNIPSVLDTDVRNGIAQDEMIDAVYAGTAGDLLKAAFAGRHDRADTNIAKIKFANISLFDKTILSNNG